MSNLLEGKKTYIGLAVALCGVLGLTKYITGPETETLVANLFEIIGIALAIYGRAKAKPKQ